MNRKNFEYKNWRMDDEEEEEKEREDKRDDLIMLNKRLEKYFFERREVYLWGVVDDKSARETVSKFLLLDADKPGEEIKFYINSPGGSVTAGLAIYDTMQYVRPQISTVCVGQAASMGAVLLAAGAKGKRYALPHSRIMIHQPLGGFQGQAADIDIQAREILRMREDLNNILMKHTGQSLKKIEKDTDRDLFMNGKQAKEYGLVDEVIATRPESSLKK